MLYSLIRKVFFGVVLTFWFAYYFFSMVVYELQSWHFWHSVKLRKQWFDGNVWHAEEYD